MQSAEETNLAQSPWFIVMMVLIAVLILFLIIICFIKRSRGEKYNGMYDTFFYSLYRIVWLKFSKFSLNFQQGSVGFIDS